jgi:hypothetical protein
MYAMVFLTLINQNTNDLTISFFIIIEKNKSLYYALDSRQKKLQITYEIFLLIRERFGQTK